ncbi:hypothetical protein [Sorangium sp. So ce233]|uniref:hypothetical protein n=1 Tax=Sorangium sp. So ce233 TaxID=3133290 RepID=UPI003F605F64
MVSSGRQIPTSEQPLHFGLSTSGVGMAAALVTSRARAAAASVAAISASSIAIGTRRRGQP